MTGVAPAEAVTNGRLLLPANTVILLSGSIRTAISAPTRLRRSARMRPVIRPVPEMPTSAFGALATMVPSGSRTTMSRMRSAVRPLASRSSCVPPTSTSCPPPKFSLIAAVSQGVAMSSSIGPLDRRHQSAASAMSSDGCRASRRPARACAGAATTAAGLRSRTAPGRRVHGRESEARFCRETLSAESCR